MTTNTALRSLTEAHAVADEVNSAVQDGRTVLVNGREVWSRWSRTEPAKVWLNGSVSVDVRGRQSGKQGTVWVRSGETVAVTVS